MTNAIDSALTRIDNIVKAMSSVTFRGALDFPTDSPPPFPFALAYLGGGEFHATNATIHHNFPAINVEFHFSRLNPSQASKQINAVALEFPKRLAGDPTLNSTIDTIVMGRDEPIQYTVRPFQWSAPNVTPIVTSQMLLFSIPIKTLQAPQSTA